MSKRLVIHCFQGSKDQQDLFYKSDALSWKPEIPFPHANKVTVILNEVQNSVRGNRFMKYLESQPNRYAIFYPHDDLRSKPFLLRHKHYMCPLHPATFSQRIQEAATNSTYTAADLRKIYNFPVTAAIPNNSVAVLSFGGNFLDSDMSAYWNRICGYSTYPKIDRVSVDGTDYKVGEDSGSDTENTLDLQVVGGVNPQCHLVFYSAPNTITGFYDALNTAINDSHKNTVISISWGAPELEFGDESSVRAISHLCEIASSKGINITVASGDNGSSDGDGTPTSSLNVDFPSSSPFVVSCGGTTRTINSSTTSATETAWSWNPQYQWGTGGGISQLFSCPSYQNHLIPYGLKSAISMRAVPDISTVADPLTPIVIYQNGQVGYIGGTSASAPTIAGMISLLDTKNQFITPILYQNRNNNFQTNSSWFRNITSGTNPYYRCGPSSFSCVCGIGTIDGTRISQLFTTSKQKDEEQSNQPMSSLDHLYKIITSWIPQLPF